MITGLPICPCTLKFAPSKLTSKREEEISTEKSSQEISIKDGSSDDSIDIELNATGCNLDIPKTFDRFEPKSYVNNYRFFNSISIIKISSFKLNIFIKYITSLQ